MKPIIYQVEQIGSGFLAVMAKPVAGEWVDEEFKSIAEFGIKQIVSLLEIHESYDLGLIEEEKLAQSHGMKFLQYPIKDRGVPESRKGFSIVTKNLYHQIASGENTVIHCRAGIGRTGLVAAGILLHCGFSVDDAFEQISNFRGVNVPDTQEQIDWLKNLELSVI